MAYKRYNIKIVQCNERDMPPKHVSSESCRLVQGSEDAFTGLTREQRPEPGTLPQYAPPATLRYRVHKRPLFAAMRVVPRKFDFRLFCRMQMR